MCGDDADLNFCCDDVGAGSRKSQQEKDKRGGGQTERRGKSFVVARMVSLKRRCR